ncbi:ribosomal protein S2, flavodoxin-like domain-containing protein [Hysterangium stoloniferum]|nr:ribosomal protein S2, flavodoxin-like domain-containing protein [Hysterangium stoloniferum]
MSVRHTLTALHRSCTRRGAASSLRRAISTETDLTLELEELGGAPLPSNDILAAELPRPTIAFADDVPAGMRHVLEMKLKRERFSALKGQFYGLGSTQTRENTWQPHHELHRPAHPSELTLSALMAAGAHLGHSKALLNPAFAPYAYGTRAGITIINLDTTLPLLRRAAALVRAVALHDGTVVFVGTRPDLKVIVEKAAQRMAQNAYHVGDRWLPGTLTNRVQVFGPNTSLAKRVIPDLVVFLNPIANLTAIRECAVSHVPTVGIIDSNIDPRIVMYPIPANDESTRTAELVAGVLSIAGREGNELRRTEIDEVTEIRAEMEAEERARSAERKFRQPS